MQGLVLLWGTGVHVVEDAREGTEGEVRGWGGCAEDEAAYLCMDV